MYKPPLGRDLTEMQESLESSTELELLKTGPGSLQLTLMGERFCKTSVSQPNYSTPYSRITLSPPHRKTRNGYKPLPPLLSLKTKTPLIATSQNQWWVNRMLKKFNCSCSILCSKEKWHNQDTEYNVLLLSRSPSASPESLRTFNLSPTRALTSLSVEECTRLTEGIRSSISGMTNLDLGEKAVSSSSNSNPPQNMSASVRTSRGSPAFASPPLLNFRRCEEYMMNLPSSSPMEIFGEEYRINLPSQSPQPESKEQFDTESCFEREVLQMCENPKADEVECKKNSGRNSTPDFRTFLQRQRSYSSGSLSQEEKAPNPSPRSIEEWPVSTPPITNTGLAEGWMGIEENIEDIMEETLPELIYAKTSSSLIKLVHEVIQELRAGFRKIDGRRSGLVSRHDVETICLLYDLDLFNPEHRAAGLWPSNGSWFPNQFQYNTFLVLLSQQLRRGPLQDRVVKNWYRIDLMVLGDRGVGKSSFIARALDGRHARLSSRASDSLEFSVIPFWRHGNPGVVRLWDIPVGPKFPALAHYYDMMNGFLLLSWLPGEQDLCRERGVSHYYEGRADHNFLASGKEWVNQLPAGIPVALFINEKGEEQRADKSKLTPCCSELEIDNIFVGSVYTGEGVDNAFKWIMVASIESKARGQSSPGQQIETEGSIREPSPSPIVHPTIISNNVVFQTFSNELPLEPLCSEDFPAAQEITPAVKQVKSRPVTKSRTTAPVELAVYPTLRTPQRVRVNLHPGYSFLSVREGPSLKSRLLGKIVEGTILTVLEKTDDWIRHELGWTAQRWNDRVWLTPTA